MTTELAQLIALTSYGNEFLNSGNLEKTFYPDNSTLQPCNQVTFSAFKKRLPFLKRKEIQLAQDPNSWFRYLKESSCKAIRIYYRPTGSFSFDPEYMLAGMVGGGGQWLLETIFDGYSHYWSKNWATKENAPDNKIWTVNYGRYNSKLPSQNLQIDITEERNLLSNVLDNIRDFAREESMHTCADRFEKAKFILNHPNPQNEYYHHDLILLQNYSLAAAQLIFAAGEAWVFGGMGWWNDNHFDDTQRYETLTEQLYQTINRSIIAVANSY